MKKNTKIALLALTLSSVTSLNTKAQYQTDHPKKTIIEELKKAYLQGDVVRFKELKDQVTELNEENFEE